MSILATILENPLIEVAARIGGLSLLAGAVTALASFVFRARARVALPEGAALILGLGAVAIYLNTRLIFVQFVGDTGDPLNTSEALVNVSVFVAAGVACYGGRYVGDKAGTSNRIDWDWLQPNLSPIVRATGLSITVALPDDVADIDGYDEVPPETKNKMAGRTLHFTRGITLSELESGVVARLKEEHDIGYVDIDIAVDGTVEYLAVGQRASGIGPTLPPDHAAVAVRADPPFSATSGDTVQLWRTGSNAAEERLGAAELRASAGSVVTLSVDDTIATSIDPTDTHRLMTLSGESYPDREFAAMLRRGDETMSVFEFTADSPFVGHSVKAIDATVIAVRDSDGTVDTIPKRDRRIQAGDCLYAIGQPDALRQIESATGTQLLDFQRIAAANESSPADRSRPSRDTETYFTDDAE